MLTSTTILETERLLLREFNSDDVDFIVELLNTPGWIEFIGDRNINTPVDAHTYLENGPIRSYAENGFGLSMVELKITGVPIGMCGLIKRDTLEDVDIGFALLPEFAESGYGYEIAKATLELGRGTLGLKRIVAITRQDNEASIGLLKKIGMEFEKLIEGDQNGENLMLFGVEFVE